jgi:Spy/CpxP family protein refolding chaperone
MKSLKGLLVIGIAVMSFGSIAQEKGEKKMTPEQRAEKITQKMQKQLELTEAQTKKISSANLEMINSKRAIQSEMQALRAKVKALKENQRIQYKNILTAEQMQKLEDIRAKRKENKGSKDGKGPKGKGHKGK